MQPELKEVAEPTPGQIVMPFYVVCDVSYSMKNEMADLNMHLHDLYQAIIDEPIIDDVARLAVLTFSGSAEVVLPLQQVSAATLPTLQVKDRTDYGSAFRLLAHTIDADTIALKVHGYKVFRPCAFFLTDGKPLDSDWSQTFTNTLTYNPQTGRGNQSHPIFVPFGYRDAPEAVLRQLAYPPERGRWYMSRSAGPAEALAGVLEVIQHTVMATGSTAHSGKPQLLLPPPKGDSDIVSGPSEYQPDYV